MKTLGIFFKESQRMFFYLLKVNIWRVLYLYLQVLIERQSESNIKQRR